MKLRSIALALLFAACTSGAPHEERGAVSGSAFALMKGQTGAANGDSEYCNDAAHLCSFGEGDCDNNAQCAAGLSCVPNQGAVFGLAASVDICEPLHCASRSQDADETGVDCGGSCAPCGSGVSTTSTAQLGTHGYCTSSHTCSALQGDCDHNTDCNAGLVCVANMGGYVGLGSNVDICMLATCHDRVFNGDETAADCGGSCPPCVGTKGSHGAQNGSTTYCAGSNLCAAGEGNCANSTQCQNGLVCVTQRGASFSLPTGDGVCMLASCNDGVQDGDETAVDCGGSCGQCVSVRGTNSTCTNGVQDGAETGVDCGGGCAACPSCNDHVQNEGEQGVDCGGPCVACLSCSDGLQNQGETGIDCGGPCAACPSHCVNTIRDADETGVDCGGAACPVCPTCSDHIRNQNETGVDCGGVCTACPSCTDHIQNQNEIGVDCGGVCTACPATCTDGVKNGAETGIDCGGPTCNACIGDTRACYTGPTVTRHVGVCADGTQTFQIAGWTSCTGDTLPSTEVCGNAVDENCDGSAPACAAAALNWAERIGGAGEEIVRSVTDPGDSSGDVIVTGTFTSPVSFGNGSTSSTNGRDSFVVRLDKSGKPVWEQYLQGQGDQFALSVAANHATNRVYVTGYFAGKFTFNSVLYTALGTGSAQDVFIATYNATTGAPISLSQLGDAAGSQQAFEVAANDKVLAVCGQYRSTMDLGGGNLPAASNQWRGFLGVWSLDHTTHAPSFAFQKSFDNAADPTMANACRSVDVNANAQVLVGGVFKGDVNIGATHFTSDDANNDGYWALFNANGSLAETHQLHGVGDTQVRRVRFASNGEVMAVGYFVNQIEYDSNAATVTAATAGHVTSFFASRIGAQLRIVPIAGAGTDFWIDDVIFNSARNAGALTAQFVESDNTYGGAGTRAAQQGVFAIDSGGGLTFHAVFALFGPGDQNFTSVVLPAGTEDAIAVGNTAGASTLVAMTGAPTVLTSLGFAGNQDGILVSEKLAEGPNTLVSADSNGSAGDNISDSASVCGDGSLIAFESIATNLVANDTNAVEDIFLRNASGKSTTRVSVDANGAQANRVSYSPSISADCSTVVYESSATNLVAGDTNGFDDVFAYNVSSGAVSLLSVDENGVQGDGDSVDAVSNSDGTRVAFTSHATNLAINDLADGNGSGLDVFLRDVPNNKTWRLSIGGNGSAGQRDSYEPSISADGFYVAFVSDSENFGTSNIANDFNGVSDIYLAYRGLASFQIATASVSTEGWPANGASDAPAISGNNRYVVFESWATNLVTGAFVDGTVPHIYRRDTQLNITELVDESLTGDASDVSTGSYAPHISADGRYVSFWSDADNLVATDTNGGMDVFVRDMWNRTTQLVTLDGNNAQVSGQTFVAGDTFESRGPAISADGTFVAYDDSVSLVASDTNTKVDVYENTTAFDETIAPEITANPDHALVDWVSQINATISVALSTAPTANVTISVTSDDTTLGTVSPSTLTFTPGNYSTLQTVTVTPVYNTAQGTFHVTLHVSASADATYAAVADMVVNVDNYLSPLVRVSVGDGTPGAEGNTNSNDVALSDDGRFIAFDSDASNLVTGDTNGAKDVFVRDRVLGKTTRVSVTPAGVQGNDDSQLCDISADGRYVLITTNATTLFSATAGSPKLIRVDLVTGALAPAAIDSAGALALGEVDFGSISGDGRFIAFDTTDSLVPEDSNGHADVYVRDMLAGSTLLVSANTNGAAASGDSNNEQISEDGRLVVFSSAAPNLVPADNNSAQDVFVRDLLAGTTTRISVATNGAEANGTSYLPLISSDGRTIAYVSGATNLISGVTSGWHEYAYDTVTQIVTLVDMGLDGVTPSDDGANAISISRRQLSGDGQFIVMATDSTNLVTGFSSGMLGVVVADLAHHVFSLWSVGDGDQVVGSANPGSTAISGDGRYIGFTDSLAYNAEDANGASDVYVNTAPLAKATPHLHAVPMGITVTNAAKTAGSHVTLSTRPSANVVLSVASSDMSLGTVSPAALTFTPANWNVAQGVTLHYVAGGAASTDAPFRIALHVTASADANYAALPTMYIAADNYTLPSLQLVSVTPTNGLSDADSTQPQLSDDGRYIVFSSGATNLVANDANSHRDVFLRDVVSGTTKVISVDSSGNQMAGDSDTAMISSDGKIIAFNSIAVGLDPAKNDNNGAGDVFVVDLTGNLGPQLVSTSGDSRQNSANSGSSVMSISGDGRYVVFVSQADDIVPGGDDLNNASDVFVYDVLRGLTRLVSHDATNAPANAASADGAISNDGKFVVFSSKAGNLVAGHGGVRAEIYLYGMDDGAISIVTNDSISDGDSRQPSISADGRYVVFSSGASTLVPSDTNGNTDVFAFDRVSNTTTCVSLNASGSATANDDSGIIPAKISNDGQFVVFVSSATNIVVNGSSDRNVYVRDLRAGTTRLYSRDESGAAAGDVYDAAISGDARFIVFDDVVGLLSRDTNGFEDIYTNVAPLEGDAPKIHAAPMGFSAIPGVRPGTTYVSLSSAPTADVTVNVASSDTSIATVSPAILTFTALNWADSQAVTITALENQVVGDQPFQVLLTIGATTDIDYSAVGTTTVQGTSVYSRLELVSRTPAGDRGDQSSGGSEGYESMDDSGRYVAFTSNADNLVANDTNGTTDVFLRDRQTGAIQIVSVTAAGVLGNHASYGASMSGDARYIAFSSDATNLVANDTNNATDIFVRDMMTGGIVRASVALNGGDGNSWSQQPSLSGDGSLVAFISASDNLVGGGDLNNSYDVFVRDLVHSTTVLVSMNSGGNAGNSWSGSPVLAAGGRYVAFYSPATDLVAGVTDGQQHVFVADLTNGTIAVGDVDSHGMLANQGADTPTISANGRYVVFESGSTNLVPENTYNTTHVFVHDFVTGITELVDEAPDGSVANNRVRGGTERISNDGRYVIFESFGTNLANGVSGNGDYYIRDLVDRTTTLETKDWQGKAGVQSGYGYGAAISGNDEYFVMEVYGALVPTEQRGVQLNEFANTTALDTTVTPGISATPDYASLDFVKSESAAIYVSLTTAPSANVVVSVDSTDTTGTTSLGTTTLTFTPGNWSMQQAVIVTPIGNGAGSLPSSTLTFRVTSTTDITYGAASDVAVTVVNATAPFALISESDAGVPGDDVSADPSFSDDGRYVAFDSYASNLGVRAGVKNAVVKDRLTGAVTLASVAPTGEPAKDDVYGTTISADGRFVAFSSYASNLSGDKPNGYEQVYVRDLLAGTTTLVSRNSAGEVGDSDSGGSNSMPSVQAATMSADGRFVAFTSTAANLSGSGDNNPDLFVRDTIAQTTELVSFRFGDSRKETGAVLGSSQISGNGRWVVYAAKGGALTDPDCGSRNIYVYDRVNMVNALVSTAPYGLCASGDSSSATITADGRYIAYVSNASNLVNNDPNGGQEDVFVYDAASGTTVLASPSSDGSGGNNGTTESRPFGAVISDSGQFVVFASLATNLDPNFTNQGNGGVYLSDLASGSVTLTTVLYGAPVKVDFSEASIAISGDGTVFAMTDTADYSSSNRDGNWELWGSAIFPGTPQPGIHPWPATFTVTPDAPTAVVHMKLLAAPTADVSIDVASTDTTLANVSLSRLHFTPANWATPQDVLVTLAGSSAIGDSPFDISFSAVSADGNYNGLGRKVNAHVYREAAVKLVSVGYTGVAPGATSQNPSVDDTGAYIAFDSEARDLLSDGTGHRAIYVRGPSGTTRVPVANINAENDNDAWSPLISSDGTVVAFNALSALLFPGGIAANDANGAQDVYVNVRSSIGAAFGVTDLISYDATNSRTANAGSELVGISGDGRFVLFASSATDLITSEVTTARELFVRDRFHRTTALASADFMGASLSLDVPAGAISNDGRFVVFESAAPNVVAGLADGRYHVYERDLVAGITTVVDVKSGGTIGNGSSEAPAVSADGRYVAFRSDATDLVSGDNNSTADIFVRDTHDGTTVCVSVNAVEVPGNDKSGDPVISESGQFVVFASHASDLVHGDTNGQEDLFIRDLVNGRTTLVSTDESGAIVVADAPLTAAISGNSRVVAFGDVVDLTSNDTNGKWDVYSAKPVLSAIAPAIHPNMFGVSAWRTGASTPFTVALSSAPTGTVVVSTQTSDTALATVSPASLTFTASNWNSPQTVRVTPVVLNSTNDAEFGIRLQVASSDDANYAALDPTNMRGVSVYSAWVVDDVAQAGTEPPEGISTASVNSDGRYVAFDSNSADLVPGDTNGATDVFVHDGRTGSITRVSVSGTGQQGDNASRSPAISSDGKYVVYTSVASNLVPGADGHWQIYESDWQAGTTVMASVDASGVKQNCSVDLPAVSRDGSRIAFRSCASNLVSGIDNGNWDVYLRDTTANTTVAVSVPAPHSTSNGPASDPQVSDNGACVVFDSGATDLVAGDTNNNWDVFSYDVASGVITAVSTDWTGAFASRGGSAPSVSANCRYVAFLSASALTPQLPGGDGHIFVRDMVSGYIELVDETIGGGGGGGSSTVSLSSISADGRYVAFESTDANLVSGVTDNNWHSYVRDLVNHTTRLSSVDSSGAPVIENGSIYISGNGQFVVENTTYPFDPSDANGATDAYENATAFSTTVTPRILANPDAIGVDASTSTTGTFYVSLTTAPTANVTVNVANDDSTGVISFSPSSLIFTPGNWSSPQPVTVSTTGPGSLSSMTLSIGATTDATYSSVSATTVGVYNHTPTLKMVSYSDANVLGNGDSATVSLSEDGRYVAFASGANNLVPGDTNNNWDVFVRDNQTGTIVRASVSSAGVQGNGYSSEPAISADGNFVAFYSQSTTLTVPATSGQGHIFLRDLVNNKTTLVSANSAGVEENQYSNFGCGISGDGRFVSFQSASSNLGATLTSQYAVYVRDTLLGMTKLVSDRAGSGGTITASASVFGMAMSANGRYVVFTSPATDLVLGHSYSGWQVYRHDMVTGLNELMSRDVAGNQSNGTTQQRVPTISGDGRYVVVSSTATNLDPAKTNGSVNDLFVYDSVNHTTSLVTHSPHGGGGNGTPYDVSMSADGQFVFFVTDDTNLRDPAGAGYFRGDLVNGTNTLLNVDSSGIALGWNGAGCAISPDGTRLAFADSNSYTSVSTQGHGQVYESLGPPPLMQAGVQAWPQTVTVTNTATTQTVHVKLNSKPRANVQLAVSSANTSAITVSPATLTFTSANWSTAQDVTVSYGASPSPGDTSVVLSFGSFVSTDANYTNPNTIGVLAHSYRPPSVALVSTQPDGTTTNGASKNVALNDNASVVAFESLATNITASDTNGYSDIFVGAGTPGAQLIVSSSAVNGQGNHPATAPLLSSDGNIVAFTATATNLPILGSDSNTCSDVFVNSRASSSYGWVGASLISVDTGGLNASNGCSTGTSISGDGRFVVFSSTSTNLIAGDANGVQDVFVRDRFKGASTLVSQSTAGVQGNASSDHGAISNDGRFIAFDSSAGNLVAGVGANHVYVRDVQNTKTNVVDITTASVLSNGASSNPSISGDGRYVVFTSAGTNLVAGDTNAATDVFVRDTTNNTTSCVSVKPSGNVGGGASSSAVISQNGQFVAFISSAANLVANDTNNAPDIFVRDLVNGTTTLYSTDANGALAANTFVGKPAFSGNSQYLAFDDAVALVTADTNGVQDVYKVTAPLTGLVPAIHAAPQGVSVLRDDIGTPVLVSLSTKPAADVTVGVSSTDTTVATVSPSTLTFTTSNWNTPQTVMVLGKNSTSMTDVGFRVALQVTASADATYSSVTPLSLPGISVGSALEEIAEGADGTQANATPDSGTVSVDATGRYVVFASRASNLGVANTAGIFNIYMRDNVAGTTQRISAAASGQPANCDSSVPRISSDARWIVYLSCSSNLVAGMNFSGYYRVYRYDTVNHTTVLVDLAANGDANTVNGNSFAPSISDDGSLVAFYSNASTLVANDTNGLNDIFMRDMAQGATFRASFSTTFGNTNGDSVAPFISASGSTIVFESVASNLVAGYTNTGNRDIYAYDVDTGLISAVSVDSHGRFGSYNSFTPTTSANGRYTTFSSYSGLVPSVTAGVASHVYVHDSVTGYTELVDETTTGGVDTNNSSWRPSISSDGRFVSFISFSDNLKSGDSNGGVDILLRDLVNHTTQLETQDIFGQQRAYQSAGDFQLSANDQFFAFWDSASFAPNDNNSNNSIYENTTAFTTTVTPGILANPDAVSVDATTWTSQGIYVALSTAPTANVTMSVTTTDTSGGTSVGSSSLTFTPGNWSTPQTVSVLCGNAGTSLSNVVFHVTSSADANYATVADAAVAVYNTTLRFAMDSRSTAGTLGTGSSYAPTFSADGRYVAFTSSAANLVSGDNNGTSDVFVKDTTTGATKRASVSTGGSEGNQQSYGSMISADGNSVVFLSRSTNLVSPATNGSYYHVYKRDLAHNITTLVSVNSSGVESNNTEGGSGNPGVSGDGRFVVFDSLGTNFGYVDGDGQREVFVRDTLLGTTTMVSVLAGSATPAIAGIPVISADGEYIAYEAYGGGVLTSGTSTGNCWQSVRTERRTGVTLLASVTNGGVASNGCVGAIDSIISGDGRFVAFGTSRETNLSAAKNTTNHDYYVHDFVSGTTTLATIGLNGFSGNGSSGNAAISGDGQYLIFQSAATNLVASGLAPGGGIFVRDLTAGTTTLLNSGASGIAPSPNTAFDAAASFDGTVFGFDDSYSYTSTSTGNRSQIYQTLARPAGMQAGIQAWPRGVTVTSNAPAATIHVKLNRAPTANVLVGVTSSSAAGTVSPAALNFTKLNWNTPQDVTVTAGTGAQGDNAFNVQLAVTSSTDASYSALATYTAASHYVNLWPGPFTLASRTSNSPVTGYSSHTTGVPSLSDDGRYVAYQSNIGTYQVAVYDTQTQTNTWASKGNSGGWSSQALGPVLSADGKLVMFNALDGSAQLPGGCSSVGPNMYVRNLTASTTALVSASTTGGCPNAAGSVWYTGAMSGDGRYVAFTSSATNLVASSASVGIYVRDLVLGKTEIVSVNPSGTAVATGSSGVSISQDGRYVVFDSSASGLVTGASDGQVYMRDRLNAVTTVVSSTASGTLGNGYSYLPVVSGNGRYVAYVSTASNLTVPAGNVSYYNILVTDTVTQLTSVVSISDAGAVSLSGAPYTNAYNLSLAISADGEFVGFGTSGTDLYSGRAVDGVFVRDIFRGVTTHYTDDINLVRDQYTNRGLALSGDGNAVAFTGTRQYDSEASCGGGGWNSYDCWNVWKSAAPTTVSAHVHAWPMGVSVTATATTAPIHVVLSTKPTANVVINFVSSNTAAGTVSPAALTFTTANWSTAQDVTVTRVAGGATGDTAFNVTMTMTGTSDTIYSAVTPPTIWAHAVY